MTLLSEIAIAGITLIAGSLAFAPKRELVTQIDIDATPAQVWDVLSDASAYPNWNPFLVSMQGELLEGKKLTNRMRTTAGSEISFSPTVLKVENNRELRWLGRMVLPRIFDGEHYFILEDRGGFTRLIHGERFRGILLWFLDVRQFKGNFEALNEALKRRVEAIAADRGKGGSFTSGEQSVLRAA